MSLFVKQAGNWTEIKGAGDQNILSVAKVTDLPAGGPVAGAPTHAFVVATSQTYEWKGGKWVLLGGSSGVPIVPAYDDIPARPAAGAGVYVFVADEGTLYKWNTANWSPAYVGPWADVTRAVDGAGARGIRPTTYTDADGMDWQVWSFVGSLEQTNAITTTDGFLDVLMVSGGGAGIGSFPGNGGSYRAGIMKFTAGTHKVMVGTGGLTRTDYGIGGRSYIQGVAATGVGGGGGTNGSRWGNSYGAGAASGTASDTANLTAGIVSDITGTDVTYGAADAGFVNENTGSGGHVGGNGTSGIVIVRRPA